MKCLGSHYKTSISLFKGKYLKRRLFANTNKFELPLNDMQKEVLHAISTGQNVFFTGSAGTGKSFLLDHIVAILKNQGKNIAITASTGIAAEHIGGTTLHSLVGIGVPVLRSDFEKLSIDKKKAAVWQGLDTIIIDEISMVSGNFFDLLEEQVAKCRYQMNNYKYKPFGGIQLIVCGDFFQIPPVIKDDTNVRTKSRLDMIETRNDDLIYTNSGYCFEANTWHLCFPPSSHFELTEVFRQRDQAFIDLLNQARIGQMSPADLKRLSQSRHTLSVTDGIQPTQLYSMNKGVRFINETQLANLPSQEFSLKSMDQISFAGWNEVPFNWSETPVETANRENIWDLVKSEVAFANSVTPNATASLKFKETILRDDFFWLNCQAVSNFKMKIGAQCMLIKNLDVGTDSMLVNGSRGVIIGFETDVALILIQLMDELAKLKQSPPKRDGPQPRYEAQAIRRKIEFIAMQKNGVYPYVRFVNGKEKLILPEYFSSEIAFVGRCVRYQIPLKLAWALTIHKCQGLTLDKATISLAGVFECGQAYVALSRVRSFESMQIKALPKQSLMVNERVCAFYRDNFPNNPAYQSFAGLSKGQSEGWID
jgi:ATP-dependent DNA helicase PIF1